MVAQGLQQYGDRLGRVGTPSLSQPAVRLSSAAKRDGRLAPALLGTTQVVVRPADVLARAFAEALDTLAQVVDADIDERLQQPF